MSGCAGSARGSAGSIMGASATTALREAIDDFAAFGVRAFTTTLGAGSFSTSADEPAGEVMGRWDALRAELSVPRFATARQVHGDRVAAHTPTWEGWLRVDAADGHLALDRGIAMAVSVADCVPVFLAHPSGAIALLHAGWRGTAACILERALSAFGDRGLPARELAVHLGPAICGRCYEVSPDVFRQITGRAVATPTCVDLREALAERARQVGVRAISISPFCTRCDNDRFFSHRAGDWGRQLGVLLAER